MFGGVVLLLLVLEDTGEQTVVPLYPGAFEASAGGGLCSSMLNLGWAGGCCVPPPKK